MKRLSRDRVPLLDDLCAQVEDAARVCAEAAELRAKDFRVTKVVP